VLPMDPRTSSSYFSQQQLPTGCYNRDGAYLLCGTIPGHCKISVGQISTGIGLFSQHFDFPLSISFHQCFILFFICTLLLVKGQTDKAWEPSKKQCSFGNQGALDGKVLSLFSTFIRINLYSCFLFLPVNKFQRK